ncbi:MAG TPA: nucleoside triphosphate pyrophosphohydrolase [Chitinophagales bacterium]|nr:nucleoside triphosphate pyrophosphohydrolase [Chitinophagales bacterium]
METSEVTTDPRLVAFKRILDIMDELREKCPWDKKQTLESLRILTIEETYELAETITNNDLVGLKEELGDLLLHIVFYARIGKEKGAFDITAVINDLCEKLILRHPHIYGDVKVNNEEDVKQNWEKIKQQTSAKAKKGLLSGVPTALPAMVKAYRMQDKAKQVGFEWENSEQVWVKVGEEMKELHEVVLRGDQKETHKEFGDVLFALVNYARFVNVDPEAALDSTNKKFYERFNLMEQMAAEQNRDLSSMTLDEQDALWNKAKVHVP